MFNVMFLLAEVYIRIPSQVSIIVGDKFRPFNVRIEYALENPQAGIHFYVPDDQSSPEVRQFWNIAEIIYSVSIFIAP